MSSQSINAGSKLDLENNSEIEEQKKVTRISALHVVLIFVIKIIVSFFSQSLSFFAELTDSIIDFIALLITYFGLKESRRVADYRHMFGHYKINSAAGFGQALLIIGMYAYIFFTAAQTLILVTFYGVSYQTENTLIQAVVLIVILGMVYFDSSVIIKIGKRQNNSLIIGQGANFRGDLYRNISIIVGLIIMSFGFAILDLVLALILSVRSVIVGGKLMRKSLAELIDSNVVQQETLEDIENKIKRLPDIKHLDFFAISTLGNNLDSQVMIRVAPSISIFGGNLVSDEIRKIIQDQFEPNFKCNVIIQFNPEKAVNPLELEYLFEFIRDICSKEKRISNVHKVSIDDYHDKILVQYHLNLDATMRLSEGHKIASELEHSIYVQLQKQIKNKKRIQVVSHVEPALPETKMHSHSVQRPVSEGLKNQIILIINKIPNVKGIKELYAQEESEGIYIVITIYMDPNKTIEESHEVTVQIESIILREIPELKRILIHVEPMM